MEEKFESPYTKLSPEEIADRLRRDAQPGSHTHEEIKGALLAVICNNMVCAIRKHEEAATSLSNRILWLNIILGIFTIVGAVIAALQALGKL